MTEMEEARTDYTLFAFFRDVESFLSVIGGDFKHDS